jgi:ornithine carbamoyltransferase
MVNNCGGNTMKHFLTLTDYTRDELLEILHKAYNLKHYADRDEEKPLEGKSLGMIFQKNSTRTRVSFEVGMFQLGGYALYLNANDMQLGRGENVADTARTLSQYLDGIMIRANDQKDIETLANYSNVPVINGLSDLYHPAQVLSDMYTVMEKKGIPFSKDNLSLCNNIKIAYVGDGNNVAHSLINAASILGMHIVVACPKEYMPSNDIVNTAINKAKETGGSIIVEKDVGNAVYNADVIYSDVWVSMGDEKEKQKRLKILDPYQVNQKLVNAAKNDVIVMHCLPAHRGEEITDEVLDGPNSVVFEQAGNRLHVQKAIILKTMEAKP